MIPSPHGNQNVYENPASSSGDNPVYFDPSQNPHAYQPGIIIAGHPGGGKSSYVYPAYAPGRNFGAVSRKEANTKATIALVLGIVSFFTFGLFLSIPGYVLAKQAEIVNGENSKAARIVNLISIWLSVVGVLLFILVITIAGVSHLQ